MTTKERRKARDKFNTWATRFCRIFHAKIPLDDILGMLRDCGFRLDEENEEGFLLCGRTGNARFDLMEKLSAETAPCNPPYFKVCENHMLILYWLKHDTGSYELNFYLS